MLQRTGSSRTIHDGEAYEQGGQQRIDLVEIIAFLKSSRRAIGGWAIFAVTLALVYSFTTAPEYTAIASLILDTRKIQLFKSDSVVGDNAMDAGQVESQVEVLRSENIAIAVIRDLRLTQDPEFVNPQPGLLLTVIRALFSINDDGRAKSEFEKERSAVNVFRGNLTVRRIGLTYVLEISYRSLDPEKAARVANAIADAYIVEQLDTKYQATRRASVWLQERIAELRNQSNTAAREVQDYKAKNSIIDTGARGLLSDLQLQEFNTQMIAAAGQTAEAKARLERIEAVLKSPAPDEALGTVSDTLKNDVITGLRTKYLAARQREADWSARFGRTHLAAVNARNEMHEIQRSIVDELRRIADSYRSDFEIAKTREETMRAALQEMIKQAGVSGQAQVNLRELESAAQTYRTIFENFLQKYTEAVQQQSFPVSEARLITAATRPFAKSHPKTALIALLGLLAGTGLGLGHAIVMRNFDRVLRTPKEVEQRTGFDCLALVPIVEPPEKPAPAIRTPGQGPPSTWAKDAPAPAEQLRPIDVMDEVVRSPLSRFTESLRAARTSIDITALTRPMKCIGVISAVPNEGKSTISVNLAKLFAISGRTTLLIDGDMRNPELSRTLADGAERGLIEVMAGSAALTNAIAIDPVTKLAFLPVVTRQRIANSSDLLASDEMRRILAEAATRFEHIIVDLPPLGAVVDARAMSPHIDAFVVVVEWRKTRYDVLNEALAGFGVAAEKIVGVVLNKVNYRELNDLDGYSRGYYHNKFYSRYGYTQQ